MKRKTLARRLFLNKKTIAHLDLSEMRGSMAGASPTEAGKSCFTETCCNSVKLDCGGEEFRSYTRRLCLKADGK